MDLTATVERLASNPDLQTLDSSTRDTIKSLRSLLNDQRFQKSYQFAQKVTTSKILHKPRTAALTSLVAKSKSVGASGRKNIVLVT